MSEHGELIAPGTVRFERTLPGPVERVWSYLTESEARARWLAGGRMDLRVGGDVELHFRHEELSAEADPIPERHRQYEHATMRGRVTQCDPPHRLSYTWGEASGEDSEVTFELSALETGDVRFVLTHRRLADRAALLDVSGGWHAHLAVLEDVLADRPARPYWAIHTQVEAEYAERLPG
jgi:uncharacterized protein YndB with AHSA1/START domain